MHYLYAFVTTQPCTKSSNFKKKNLEREAHAEFKFRLASVFLVAML